MNRSLSTFLFGFYFFWAMTSCNSQDAKKTITLHIGEAVNFATGSVSKEQNRGDMVFMYLPPQSPHGWRYNPVTGMVEYQVRAMSTENYPLLSAAKTGAFKTMPDISKMTVGDINQWTQDEFDVGPGRFIIVRGLTDGKHWLIKTTKLSAVSNDPKTWQISFTYEPLSLGIGASGTAGNNLILPGMLTYCERLNTEKIISLTLSDGGVQELFDGSMVSRNRQGEYVYVNRAKQLVLTDGSKKQLAVLPSPSNENYGSGPVEVSFSPNGKYIAVGVMRRVMHQGSGFSVPSVPMRSLAVIDRNGREQAAFISAVYPAWTPDGRLLMADPDKQGLFITDAFLKNLHTIPNVPAGHIDGIAVNPDGKQIAFALNNRIWLINMDGTGLRQLTQSGLNEVTPVWSPDGKYLAFQQSMKDKKDFFNVLVIRMSDLKAQIITDRQGSNREPSGTMNWN